MRFYPEFLVFYFVAVSTTTLLRSCLLFTACCTCKILFLRTLGHPWELAHNGTKRNVNFSMHQTLVTYYLPDHHMLMAASDRAVKVACQRFPQRLSIPHWARHFVIHQIPENPLPKKC